MAATTEFREHQLLPPNSDPIGSAMNHATRLADTAASALDDMELARRVAAGDRAAFNLLMRRNNRRLYRLARATLRDDGEAEEALQEAYLAAYCCIGGFRGESSLATWLSRMVLNECLARLRKSARRDRVIPMVTDEEIEFIQADEHDLPDRVLVRAEVRELIERKLDELPEDFRLVFMLRSVQELSVEETADSLGIEPATVRTRHFRARCLLREALARDIDVASRDLFSFGGARCDRIVATVNTRLGE
jgi:RNA polymerase sigma-70 factor (ECF subfamily)